MALSDNHLSNSHSHGASSKKDVLWEVMRGEAHDIHDPFLSRLLQSAILSQASFEHALAHLLSVKLADVFFTIDALFELFYEVLSTSSDVVDSVLRDMEAVLERDPACPSYCHCFLNFKGFQACQAYRISHQLWEQNRGQLAMALQSRISEVFAVDIHPAARIGKGVLFDHATGVVIGETAVVGDDVAILHGVTLGGTGKHGGDRHPKIGNGVLIGAGATVIGNIKVGDGAKIGSGAVVLMEVPPRTTAVGIPARLVGGKAKPTLLREPSVHTMDHVSYVLDWSDYVI